MNTAAAPDPTPEPEETAYWTARAKAGDGDAFNRLHGHLGQRLLLWLRGRMPARPDADLVAEDVAQTAWITAWSEFARLDTTKYTFRKWLFGIARHRLLQGLRDRNSRNRGAGGPANIAVVEGVPQSIVSLVPSLARADVVGAFRDYMATLGEVDRELVLRCGLEGVAAKAVAERIASTAEAVTKRWQRLREKMKGDRRLRGLVDRGGGRQVEFPSTRSQSPCAETERSQLRIRKQVTCARRGSARTLRACHDLRDQPTTLISEPQRNGRTKANVQTVVARLVCAPTRGPSEQRGANRAAAPD